MAGEAYSGTPDVLSNRAVGVVVNAVGGYSRGVLRGIASYAAGRGWRLGVAGVNVPAVDPMSGGWAGVLAQVGDDRAGRELVERCAAAGVPLVNISGALAEPSMPTVVSDDVLVGRLGAEHLLRIGRRRLLFYGPDPRAFVERRRQGFVQRAVEGRARVDVASDPAGLRLHLLESPVSDGAGGVGVMACNDRIALDVLEMCRRLRRRVPEDVAVLGVDDDDLMQSLADPPLSSVNTARDRVGFEAAAMLDRMMQKGAGGPDAADGKVGAAQGGGTRLLVAPKGVVSRRSTDLAAVGDRDVAEAIRFIYTHAGRPITVDDVVAGVAVGRRQLERKFRRVLGRSVLAEMTRCRVDRARQLLGDTELTLEQVAFASGFTSASYFSVVFKRWTGLTPQRFRDAQRSGRLTPVVSGGGAAGATHGEEDEGGAVT